MSESRFIEPLDVLYLRGNKLFGDPGSHGEALMPPWPSMIAGALRSRMLADAGVTDLDALGQETIPQALRDSLGTVDHPGDFQVAAFSLARRDEQGKLEFLMDLPSDLVVCAGESSGVHYLRPQTLAPGLSSSCPLAQLPCLAVKKQVKPVSGRWLNARGAAAYLAGSAIDAAEHTVAREALWRTDPRLGIALDGDSATARSGQIYTAETVAFQFGCGFLVSVTGADDLLPADGLLRLGGDGRGARLQAASAQPPQPPWARIAEEKRFRVVLSTPGLFAGGWRLPGLGLDQQWQGNGFSARLIAASIARAATVSGWDLAKNQPKTALRAAPTGSVYWFEDFSGDIAALKRIYTCGLWPLDSDPDPARRAEGFNRITIAAWSRHSQQED